MGDNSLISIDIDPVDSPSSEVAEFDRNPQGLWIVKHHFLCGDEAPRFVLDIE
jgi:hypothetical protein